MDAYYDAVTTAIEDGDMTTLPSLWNLTLVAKAAGDGAFFREKITKKIPQLAEYYGMEPLPSFLEFASRWNAEMLGRDYMKKNGSKEGLENAIEELMKRKETSNVKYLAEKRTDFDWYPLVLRAISSGQNDLATFFFSKLEDNRRNRYLPDSIREFAQASVSQGNLELIRFFLGKSNSNLYTITTVLRKLFDSGREDFVDELLREVIIPHTLSYIRQTAELDRDKRFYEFLDRKVKQNLYKRSSR